MNLHYTVPLQIAAYAALFFASAEAQSNCSTCISHADGGVFEAPCPTCGNYATPMLGSESERGPGSPVAACSGPFCGYECRSEGWVFTVDTVWIDIFQEGGADIASQLIPLQNMGAPGVGEIDPGFDPSLRVSIGWQTDDNWAVRARYWEFDTFASKSVPFVMAGTPDLAVHNWHINMFDLELANNAMTFHDWDTTLSAGYRFVNYEEDGTLLRDSVDLASAKTRYIGHGISGAAEARRLVRPWLVALANTRVSLVGGGETFTVDGITPKPSTAGRHTADARFIYEAQLAAQWIRPICGGGYYYIRGGVEFQYWDEFVAQVQTTDRQHLLLGGLVFAVGLQR